MQEHSHEELQKILEGQKLFFASGQTRELAFRQEYLQKLQAAVISREQEIMSALAADLGKCPTEAYATEIGIVLKSLKNTLKNLNYWAGEEKVPTPLYLQPGKSKIIREPYGNVLIMSPFNYPFQLTMEPLIAAVAAGNTCILKPSELAPATSHLLKDMLSEVFDSLYVSVVEGGVETNTNLLKLPFDYIFFTGSRKVGQIVMRAAAEHLTPLTLELGGKSPVIVDETANLEAAAQ